MGVVPLIPRNNLSDVANAATARSNLAALGGSLGSADNRLLRSDGTGGATAQASGINCDDSVNVSGINNLTASGNAQANRVISSNDVEGNSIVVKNGGSVARLFWNSTTLTLDDNAGGSRDLAITGNLTASGTGTFGGQVTTEQFRSNVSYGSMRHLSSANENRLAFHATGGSERFWIQADTNLNTSQIGSWTSKLNYYANLHEFTGPATFTGNLTASGTGSFGGTVTIGTGTTGYGSNGQSVFYSRGAGTPALCSYPVPSLNGNAGGYGWLNSSGSLIWSLMTDPLGGTDTNLQLKRTSAATAILNFPAAGTSVEVTGSVTVSSGLKKGVLTFGTLPSASANTGFEYRLSDRDYKEVYSNGTNWLFAHDNSIAS